MAVKGARSLARGVSGNGERRELAARASLLTALLGYSQPPEHEAQHSGEAQQAACAALAVPASPSAMTAINTITFSFFMIRLLR